MESEKKQKLVIDGNSFYEIDLKCLEEQKKETGGSRKNGSRKGRGNDLCLFKRSAAIVAAASISAQKQKKDDDPTAVVAAVVITATATVVSTATHQTDDPKDTGAAVSTVSKQGISAAIITATVIVTSTSCATSGITTTSAITSTIGSR